MDQLNSMITLVFMTSVGCVTTDVMWLYTMQIINTDDHPQCFKCEWHLNCDTELNWVQVCMPVVTEFGRT